MSDTEPSLRTPLVKGLETLAMDVLLERHGDPHVAFVVFVYPDQAPTVVSVTPGRSPQSVEHLAWSTSTKKDDDKDQAKWGRFFVRADVEDAWHAMGETFWALGSYVAGEDLGAKTVARVEGDWRRRRDSKLQAELDRQVELAKPQCPYCHNRYKRLDMHLARSRYCGRREAETKAAEQETADQPTREVG